MFSLVANIFAIWPDVSCLANNTTMISEVDASRYTRPDFDAAALLTIDMQRDFLDGAPCQISGTTAILPVLLTLVETFRAAKRPIVHVVRICQHDGSNVDLCRRAAVEQGASIVKPGTHGVELAEPLLCDASVTLDTSRLLSGARQRLGTAEWAMYKPRWGAFYGTTLEEHLRGLGATTLVIAGCNYPNCPRASIYEASERDFRIVMVDDAVSGLYDQGRVEMRNIGVTLMNATDLVERVMKSATAT
jgi:nicotinamidase-related amidase